MNLWWLGTMVIQALKQARLLVTKSWRSFRNEECKISSSPGVMGYQIRAGSAVLGSIDLTQTILGRDGLKAYRPFCKLKPRRNACPRSWDDQNAILGLTA